MHCLKMISLYSAVLSTVDEHILDGIRDYYSVFNRQMQ